MLHLKWLNTTLDELLEDQSGLPSGKPSSLIRAIAEAENSFEQAEDSLVETRNVFLDAKQELETAYQAFMEEEASLACSALFAFDAEKCLNPHHQVQLLVFSLLYRGDLLKDWNLAHCDPLFKRLAVRQLLSIA